MVSLPAQLAMAVCHSSSEVIKCTVCEVSLPTVDTEFERARPRRDLAGPSLGGR